MSISDKIWEAQSSLKELKKQYRFRKERLAHEAAVDLRVTLGQCRGKLEICRQDLDRTINAQSRNIAAGLEKGTDTQVQELILWDSAIGYMLVRDAIFALETVTSYDSVSHAYEMLDAAMKQLSTKKINFPRFKIGATKERNAYGYITSAAALRAKESLLESFFSELKLYGNIEARLEEARNPIDRRAEQRHAYTSENPQSPASSSDIDERMKRLRGKDSNQNPEEEYELDMKSAFNIYPTDDSK